MYGCCPNPNLVNSPYSIIQAKINSSNQTKKLGCRRDLVVVKFAIINNVLKICLTQSIEDEWDDVDLIREVRVCRFRYHMAHQMHPNWAFSLKIIILIWPYHICFQIVVAIQSFPISVAKFVSYVEEKKTHISKLMPPQLWLSQCTPTVGLISGVPFSLALKLKLKGKTLYITTKCYCESFMYA